MLDLLRCSNQASRWHSILRNITARERLSLRTASSTSVPSQNSLSSHHARRRPPQKAPKSVLTLDENIITSSLENTLQAHRQANAEKVTVRKVKTTSVPGSPSESDPVQFEGSRRIVLSSKLKGQSICLTPEWAVRPGSSEGGLVHAPWLKGLGTLRQSQVSAPIRLTQEIKAFHEYITPSDAERRAASIAIQDIQAFLKDCLAGHILKADLVGSRQSQFAHATSDIDVNLVMKPDCTTPVGNILDKVSKSFYPDPSPQNSTSAFSFRCHLRRARVPIVCLSHKASNLECQIQMTEDCYSTLEIARGLRAELPPLAPLFSVLKHFLTMRGLATGGTHGLTSYPLLNMVATSLKLHEGQREPEDLGGHLIDFLRLFTSTDFREIGFTFVPSVHLANPSAGTTEMLADLDTSELVAQDPVGARPVRFDVRKKLRDVHVANRKFRMVLHDPANLHNNLGGAERVNDVQATMAQTLLQLLNSIDTYDQVQKTREQSQTTSPSLISGLVGGDYTLYQMDRMRLARLAEGSVVE